MAEPEAITAQFEIIRVQTMASGAIRYTFETSESELDTARQIMECRLRGAILETAMLPRISEIQRETDDEIQTRPKRKSEWKTPEE